MHGAPPPGAYYPPPGHAMPPAPHGGAYPPPGGYYPPPHGVAGELCLSEDGLDGQAEVQLAQVGATVSRICPALQRLASLAIRSTRG